MNLFMDGSENVQNHAEVMYGWSQNAKPALVVITVFFANFQNFKLVHKPLPFLACFLYSFFADLFFETKLWFRKGGLISVSILILIDRNCYFLSRKLEYVAYCYGWEIQIQESDFGIFYWQLYQSQNTI